MKLGFIRITCIVSILTLASCKSTEGTLDMIVVPIKYNTQIQDLEHGRLERIDSFPSNYVTPRGVDVWLPDNYVNTKKYSVLYMQDGQRMFTGEADKRGREMMIDETASRLIQENKIEDLIVVGIHSIGKLRQRNYFPQKPYDSLPVELTDSLQRIGRAMRMNVTINSDAYLKFIVEEVKPYIDGQYSTKADLSNTFIGGASMGGLISMYAVCEYPQIFGGAICMSTHWPGFFPSKDNPIPTVFFDYMRLNLPEPSVHKFYFDFGTDGMDRFYGQYETNVNSVFEERGYSSDDFVNNKIEGGNHSEEFWSKRFHMPLLFLLEK